LVARATRVRPGDPVVLEWRLENLGPLPLEFEFAPKWTVTEPVRSAPPSDSTSEDPRRLRLAGGEYVGGTRDLTERVATRPPGSVAVVEWSARVRWNGSLEIAIDAVPVPIEIAADE
jgi:hypothetical protein